MFIHNQQRAAAVSGMCFLPISCGDWITRSECARPCKIIGDEQVILEEEKHFVKYLGDTALHDKQGVYLGISVTFGVAVYNEIYICDVLGGGFKKTLPMRRKRSSSLLLATTV